MAIRHGLIGIMLIIAILAGFVFAFALQTHFMFQSKPLQMIQYDYANELSCESHSMGLTIPCGSVALQQKVNNAEQIEPGQIYVYEMPNATKQVVHRLVACVDNDCNMTVFKGDANKIAELIPREWIVSRVVMLQYK